jgi:diketogulonate reductase-like aldo/keto reductase
MQRLRLNSGHSIPNVGFGLFQVPPADTGKLVENALKIGYRHIDSAIVYHNESESVEAIVEFLKANPSVSREDIFYTTKVVPRLGYDSALNRIKEAIEKAKPIGYIDLFLLHSPGRDGRATIDAYRALQDAAQQGLIKSIGLSNFGVEHLKLLYGWSGLRIPPTINQIEINPWLQHDDIIEFCKQKDILIEAYSPLMRGQHHDHPDLVKLASKYNKSPAQILLRWNLQRGHIILPKTVSVDRQGQNIDLFDFQLTDSEMESLGDKSAYLITSGWDPTSWPI